MRSLLKTTLLAVTIATACAGAARADVLYNNGPANGGGDSWDITAYVVTDSFTLSAAATVTGFDLRVWLAPGDTLNSVSWSIGSAAFGTDLASGSGAVSRVSNKAENGYGYDVATYALTGLDLSLASGTDWLTLTDASTTSTGEAFWDENDGPSLAYQDYPPDAPYSLANGGGFQGAYCANSQPTCTGSETFDIIGSAPEPASVALLALGLTGLAAARRRRRAPLPQA